MASKERRERAKENLRQEIMEAARELFVTEGYANVSMRKIAEKIEYSPTTIYLYFKDKTDLLHQICEQTFANLTRELTSLEQKTENPLERLRNGMREYINFGLLNPSQYEIVFITPLSEITDDEFEKSTGKVAFEVLRQSVAACVAANLLRGGNVELISQTLWAGIHGVTSLLIKHNKFPFVPREHLINNLLDTLILGIKA
jgi:AcrR family transcriptional regulator